MVKYPVSVMVNHEDSEQNEVDGMKKEADSTGIRCCMCERAVGDL